MGPQMQQGRGLADILDVGICCLSCKKSSTKSKCASAGAARVACCELSSSLLDLSQSKRGMKLGWVLRSGAEVWQTSVGIHCLSCKEFSKKIQMCICWSCQGLVSCLHRCLSQSKRGMKLGWVLRCSSRGLADILLLAFVA